MCGKKYEACHTLRPNIQSEFRWQDVACCPEHGAEYLKQILISRGELQEERVNETSAIDEQALNRRKTKKKNVAPESVGTE